ncbi:MAG: hypothetical protein JO219_07105 [Candidatus Eremiobacteraeota bacterium]|nr:hypothetical protein [Candidatus Eremiobacteraeota bacterium]MBV8365526.1 hypothetical protein [Candidatus Eremiobacteraeota bacterium]
MLRGKAPWQHIAIALIAALSALLAVLLPAGGLGEQLVPQATPAFISPSA